MKTIWDYSADELNDMMREHGQPAFRSKQLYEWLYVHEAADFDSMTNLPKSLRAELSESISTDCPTVHTSRISADGTRKYLIRLNDGNLIETVAIPSSGDDRLTVCFSTQVGCAMECLFCATGTEGFTRNLTQGEIVFQILLAQRDFGRRVTNLVAMGQGEPFLNYEQLIRALRILNDTKGIAIGARHITVSTCGICSSIKRFAHEPEQYTLAISLHSAVQEKRDMLMPRLAEQPLPSLKDALLFYNEHKGRRVSIEYLLLDGINDGAKDLDALLDFCKDIFCHINFLPMNRVEGSPLQPSKSDVRKRWIQVCEDNGIEATLRNSRGADIDGACGQLKSRMTEGIR